MANIPVIAEINNLLDANDVTIAKAALGVLGAVTTGGTLGTPTSGTLTNATDLPIVAGTSGTLTVARGGTGATTLTSGSVLVGAGTSTPTLVAPSTSGNVLTSNGATWTSAPSAGGAVGFSAITGQPTDNASLTTALNLKTNNSVGFMEDFTNSTRWAEGAVITNNTTTPQVTATGDPYFLSVAGTASPAPNVQTRGYGAGANNQLWYLGSSVPTSGGKMSLGFKFEHRKNPTTISNFNNTFNISFNTNVMQNPSTGGAIPGDGTDAGVVHINFDRSGIASCGIYLQADFTCLSHTKVGGLYSFTKQTQGNLPLNRDFVVLIKVDGNFMTITIPTVGSFLFFSTKLPSKIGAAKTYFWFEDLKNDDYNSWGFLKKIWGGNNSILDTDPDWGGFIGGNLTSLNTGTFHVLPGTIISNSANPSTLTSGLLMADSPPSVGYGFKAAAVSATSNLANGGNVFIEGAYLSNVGTTALGGSILGRAPMVLPSAMTGPLSSAALSFAPIGITAAVLSGTTVTLTTASAHGLTGTPVIHVRNITGFSGQDPNGQKTATSASGSTITYTLPSSPTPAGTYAVGAGTTVSGPEALLKSITRLRTLAISDSQKTEIYGQLTGVLAKRINIMLDAGQGTLFDSNALSTTPLDALTGPYTIVIRRLFVNAAGASTFYTVMTLPNGTTLPMTRLSTNWDSTSGINIRFQTATAAATGVTIDGVIETVEKVINR